MSIRDASNERLTEIDNDLQAWVWDQHLGKMLVEAGKLDRNDLERACRLQESGEGSLRSILVRLGLLSEHDLAEAIASHLSLSFANSEDYPSTAIFKDLLSIRFLRYHKLVPLSVSEEELRIAIADPMDSFAIKSMELLTGKKVVCLVGIPSEIQAALDHLYAEGRTEMSDIVQNLQPENGMASEEEIERLKDLASEAPVIRLVNLIIQRAVEEQASDIHIEPFESQLKVRYRVDGMLREVEAPPARLYPAVISRIKIMANLDIAERRLPQDGRIKIHTEGKEIDMRISSVPTMFGESLVMRLLYKDSALLDFHALGFGDRTLERFLDVLKMPYGIVLVTGPTGSGKTTTLYTALKMLNDPSRKILTVEDPIEYQLLGINQIQVKPQIGLTFARALRSLVRQDPDVIMVGEMRDLETAEIAVQSALTGHLVLSTLHTNDAASSITRLLDMGIEAYLVTSVVNGILAQRLVRTLCPHCRQPYKAMPELLKETKLDRLVQGGEATLYRPVGCEHCRGTGYRGRQAIMEMLVMSDNIRRLILNRADVHEVADVAISEGTETMYEDGLRKALSGLTSIEEVLRVTRED